MRDRGEIEDARYSTESTNGDIALHSVLCLEVLLDIRDILMKGQPNANDQGDSGS